MMNDDTDTTVGSSQTVCECGSDHRSAVTRLCRPFMALTQLHKRISEFLDAQALFEFGKDGPLAHGLRSMTLRLYDETIDQFDRSQTASDEHPEWNLANDLSRLRRYFDEVADGCADELLGPRPPLSVIPDIVFDENATLRAAKNETIGCYDHCYEVISQWFDKGALSLKLGDDPEGWLPMVDNAFKEAFEKITLLSPNNHEKIQDLAKKSYELWRETRRLLYDFTPPSQRPAWQV